MLGTKVRLWGEELGLDDCFTAPVLEMCFLLCPESLLHVGWGCVWRELLGTVEAQLRKGRSPQCFSQCFKLLTWNLNGRLLVCCLTGSQCSAPVPAQNMTGSQQCFISLSGFTQRCASVCACEG